MFDPLKFSCIFLSMKRNCTRIIFTTHPYLLLQARHSQHAECEQLNFTNLTFCLVGRKSLPNFLISHIPNGRGTIIMINQICSHTLASTCPHSKAIMHWSLRFLGFFTSTDGVASLLIGCCLRLRTPGRLSGRDSIVVVLLTSALEAVSSPTAGVFCCSPATVSSDWSDWSCDLDSPISTFMASSKIDFLLSATQKKNDLLTYNQVNEYHIMQEWLWSEGVNSSPQYQLSQDS